MKKILISILCFSLPGMYCMAQEGLHILKITSSNTSFPDTGRMQGHTYDGNLYDAPQHYMDSSVMLLVPQNLEAKKQVDFIFWFHGWRNNIDTAIVKYKLARQFSEAKLNAVLVLAETAKDAPDSYGGKLEQPGVFKNLLQDVLSELKKKKMIPAKCAYGNILLAGHSGAYRVMANIVQNGNVPVKEVILFDALYGDTGKFLNWIQADTHNRFVDLYTDYGGTDEESKTMPGKLHAVHASADTIEEKDVTGSFLRANRIVFIHSLNKHDYIINDPDNFRLFIENTPFLKRLE
ncbi:MAG: hypothetical protein ABI472_12030 [Ginsengibacter sp.]